MHSKIKIAIDTRDLFLAKTGIRTVLEEILRGLKEDPVIEVIEISPKPFSPPKTKIQKAIEHIKFFWWKEVQLPLKVKRLDCDVLICNDYVIPYFMPQGTNAYPIFHGCNIWEIPQHYNKYWRWMFTWMAIPAGKKAKSIITVSQFSKGRLCGLFKFEVDKVKVIPLGPKRSLLTPQKLVELDRFGINEGDEYLLHVGVIEKRKNLVRLIEAFSKIQNEDLKLVLIGQRGPKLFLDDFDNVINEIKKKNLTDSVILTGHVSDEELHTFYSKAKMYVFPSLYEGFGIPVIEAFHYELLMAASNQGALPEVVGDGGTLFDPENVSDIAQKIQDILNSTPEQTEEFRERQKSMVDKYRWEKTIEEIKKIILVD
ncbi:glycosyltransferase family 4 protein [Echinicola sp. CAU 1574]|uniref:Glycosyltransferase family 4 protein n=1 Tax=Echinicola arenosa TaxID=2774144 RepID=A0ABR9AL80_9BACT|nr:glycosyltransferase family 1 protein [Echinicola arenosa]MBD8488660.1 glycosyltransferase family 4 protein [Echinicola arenosa]